MFFPSHSPWSEVVSVTTHGLPPSPPDPPRLLKSGTRSLLLNLESQSKTGTSNPSPCKPITRYQLEMQEGEARQHFKGIYDGDATTFLVEGLRRCSLYRFRLCASNADGVSHWSDIVAFRTDPDPPSIPKGLRVSDFFLPKITTSGFVYMIFHISINLFTLIFANVQYFLGIFSLTT